MTERLFIGEGLNKDDNVLLGYLSDRLQERRDLSAFLGTAQRA